MTLPPPDPAFRWSREPWGAGLRAVALEPIAQHLFTSKQLALPSEEGWRLAAASVGSTPERVMRVKQVHGSAVRVLRRGEVSAQAGAARPDGDAVAANEPGLALAVMVADCVPILLVDPVRGAAAAVHAGWRGTCARVAVRAVEAMQREFGSRPSDLMAAIGPSAGPDEYEVGPSLVEAFRDAGHATGDLARWFIRSGEKLRLDLWTANTDELTVAGVTPGHISTCRLSTVAHPEVFDSYRSAGERAGRMAAIVVVPGPA